MGWFKSMFSTDTVDKAVDAVINTGDKLFYTEEEKAEMRITIGEMHIKMLGAYAPFKIAQRAIALLFIGTFLFVHLLAVSFFIFGSVQESILVSNLAKDLFAQNNDILGLPVSLIVGFYFMGGTLESYQRGAK